MLVAYGGVDEIESRWGGKWKVNHRNPRPGLQLCQHWAFGQDTTALITNGDRDVLHPAPGHTCGVGEGRIAGREPQGQVVMQFVCAGDDRVGGDRFAVDRAGIAQQCHGRGRVVDIYRRRDCALIIDRVVGDSGDGVQPFGFGEGLRRIDAKGRTVGNTGGDIGTAWCTGCAGGAVRCRRGDIDVGDHTGGIARTQPEQQRCCVGICRDVDAHRRCIGVDDDTAQIGMDHTLRSLAVCQCVDFGVVQAGWGQADVFD